MGRSDHGGWGKGAKGTGDRHRKASLLRACEKESQGQLQTLFIKTDQYWAICESLLLSLSLLRSPGEWSEEDGWTDGWMDGWMDETKELSISEKSVQQPKSRAEPLRPEESHTYNFSILVLDLPFLM